MKTRITILLLVLVWAAVAWRLVRLPELMDAAPRAADMEDAVLFERALEAGVLQPLPDGRLEPLAEDALLKERVERALARGEGWGSPADRRRERLLWDLYHSAPGVAVRGQLRLWNQTRRLAAVRDNSNSLGVRSDGWRVYDCHGRSLAEGALVPESFGYIHQGRLKPGFGQWVSGRGATDAGAIECLEFRNRFSASEPEPITLQFVGNVLERKADQTFCPPARLQQSFASACLAPAAACEPGNEKAGTLVLDTGDWQRSDEGTRVLEAKIRLGPVGHQDPTVAGLSIRLNEQCEYVWRTLIQETVP